MDCEYTTLIGGFKGSMNVQVRSQSDVKGNINQDPTQDRPGITVTDLGWSLASRDNAYKFS